jgi:hypothetical protein
MVPNKTTSHELFYMRVNTEALLLLSCQDAQHGRWPKLTHTLRTLRCRALVGEQDVQDQKGLHWCHVLQGPKVVGRTFMELSRNLREVNHTLWPRIPGCPCSED